MTFTRRCLSIAASIALTVVATQSAGAAAADADAPADISLEELLRADVHTASRKAQRLQDVAAAVFVITREDIERSGVTSIPESLRLAPGVEVARIANNRWAVSARGFNGRFANKLLVLMDGRSIYSPLFSGVLWEMEDTLLEDVDRIEVIRGPGAALWGANAVNGVINIITRKARDTRGTLAVAGAGSDERGFVALRHGLAVGDGDLRLWAKAFSRDHSVDLAGNDGNDTWRAVRLGFRGDWNLDDGRRLTLSASAHGGPTGDRWMLPSFTSPTGVAPTAMTQNGNGAHLLARHEWLWADGSEAALQGYVDHYDLEVVGAFRERRRTVDFDFQHHPRLGGAHDIVWGLGYRESTGVVDSGVYISLPSGDRIWRMASVFMQDEFTLKPDLLRVVLGARLEHNNLTGFEPQPNARLVWTPTPQQTVWGAVSGAVRTPSRAEQDAVVDLSVIPGNQQQPPVLMRNVPLDGLRLDGEKVKAFELGFRQQFGSQLSLDLALFNNRYNSLRTATLGTTSFEFAPVPHVVQAVSPANGVRANTKGFELALDWHASKTWRIQPAYSTIRIHASADTADPIMANSVTVYNNSTPRHQLALRSSLSLSDRGQFDFWLRHVSALPSGDPRAAGVPAYTTLDLRVAWRVQPGLELSLVGQNLLDRRHVEFIPDLLPSQTLQVQRSVYVKAKWQF